MKDQCQPPVWVMRMLEKFCDPYLLEGISGDLYEVYQENVTIKGKRKANWIYTFQALGFLRWKFKKEDKNLAFMKAIWTNYLLASLRSLKRHKSFFAINLIGLITAITCSIYALVFIHDELQFDQFHSDLDQIYRVYKRHVNETEKVDHLSFETSGMMGPTMTEEYAEIESFVRVSPWFSKAIITYDQNNFATDKLYFADSTFFEVFNFPLVAGDPNTALIAPSSIVISEKMANAIFGDKNPIGESVIGLHDLNYTVTGVFEELPRRSSMQFEAVVSWTTTVPNVGPLSYRWMNNWLAQGIFTFVRLAKSANSSDVVAKLPDMMQRHFPERAENYFLKFMPMEKIHLYGDGIRYERGMKTGSITFVYTLGFSALLVLLIASVNYINIMLSRATETSTEVGIRKVLGSSSGQLMGRFVAETFISTTIATIISLALLTFLIPLFNPLIGKDLSMMTLAQPIVIFASIGFILVISFLVGIYPAMVLSSPPVSVILQGTSSVGSTGWFRKVLLVFQYAISIFLIVCTIIVIKQTSYLKNKPLGFDKEQVLVIDINNEMDQKVDVLENELLKNPNILAVSTCRSAVGSGSYSTKVFPEGYEDEMTARIFGVDQEFFETYGMQLSMGRTFLKGSIADSNRLVINKAFIDFLGWKDPIGKHVRFDRDGGQVYTIIGVIEDFHYHSLASAPIQPMILYLNTTTLWNSSVRISPQNQRETINYIIEKYESLSTRTPIDFYFVDDWFNEQYRKESQLLSMSTIYSIISIILCALGLYGLTALMLQQKQKEISIRKVLGASMSSILSMVNRQFLILIFISFLIAAPLAFVLISQWLEEFVYRINIGMMAFAVAGLVTLTVSVLIISSLSIKTANTNPSKTLSKE